MPLVQRSQNTSTSASRNGCTRFLWSEARREAYAVKRRKTPAGKRRQALRVIAAIKAAMGAGNA